MLEASGSVSHIYTLIDGIDDAVERRDSSLMPDEAPPVRSSRKIPEALQRIIDKAKTADADASKSELEKRYELAKLAKLVKDDPGKYGERGLSRLARALKKDKSTISRAASIATHWDGMAFRSLKNKAGLTWSHLEVVSLLKTQKQRDKFIETIVEKELSVRQVKLQVREHLDKPAPVTGPEADAKVLKDIAGKANKLATLLRERENLLAAGLVDAPQMALLLDDLRANLAFLQDAVQDAVAWIPAAPAVKRSVDEQQHEEAPRVDEHHDEEHQRDEQEGGAAAPPTEEPKPAPELVVEPLPEEPSEVGSVAAELKKTLDEVLERPNDPGRLRKGTRPRR